MKTNFIPKKFPTAPEGGQATSNEVVRLCKGSNNMMGAVVVGGCYCADDFADVPASESESK